MDITETSSRRYRSDLRHRRREQNDRDCNKQKEAVNEEKEGRDGSSGHQPLIRPEKETQGAVMTKDHRFYHRRQAQPATRVVTVNVDVVATVDSSGNLIGQETKTPGVPATPTPGIVDSLGAVIAPVAPVASPVVNAVDSAAGRVLSGALDAVDPAVPSTPPVPSLPQVPAVPPFPTDALPQVPAVPPFPSGFSVPAYPYGSGASALALQVTTPALSSTSSSASGSSFASITSSTSQSPPASTPSISPTTSTASFDSVSSLSASPSVSISPSSLIPFFTSTETDQAFTGSLTASSKPANPSSNGGGGIVGGQPGNPGAPAAQTSSAADASSTGTTAPLAPPQVVGSVVGSLAGAALILAVILILLRRHKRKRKGALQLGNDEPTDRAPPMSQEVSRNNRIPSAFLNRFSGISRSTVDTSTSGGGERSFQRVSGRKLPSAFSEGMTSEQFAPTGSSFYQDDHGTYGGPGFPKELGKEAGGSPTAAGVGMMNIRPSPARTPVIRHPDEDANPFADPAPFPKGRSHLSPPQSPNPERPRGTLGRSLQSADGSRSSKFTENV